jgi:hypothetical protein
MYPLACGHGVSNPSPPDIFDRKAFNESDPKSPSQPTFSATSAAVPAHEPTRQDDQIAASPGRTLRKSLLQVGRQMEGAWLLATIVLLNPWRSAYAGAAQRLNRVSINALENKDAVVF